MPRGRPADDPHRDCLPQAERIANRQHNVAARALSLSASDGRQMFLSIFNKRVSARISADLFCLESAEIVPSRSLFSSRETTWVGR